MRALKTLLLAAGLTLAAAGAATAQTAEPATPPHLNWPNDGIFGTYDRAALQRGFQVYKEVCSACHSMSLPYYRDLSDIGFTADEVKALAAQVQVTDGPNDQGQMFQRPGKPSDHFVSPFANEQAARAANGGALPPDLSLIVKARAGGADYVAAILTGYRDAPKDFKLADGKYYNIYFPGNQISMPQMLHDGTVTYTDGTKATAAQEAHDVASFLTWVAEPKMEDRKRMGVKVVLFLIVFSGIMYGVKRRVWADVH